LINGNGKDAFSNSTGSHDSLHLKGPKSAQYINVKHVFVIKRFTIILTEAVEVIRCDGQTRTEHFHKRLSIIRGILVTSFKRE
jgi:hypothetical protein